MICRDVLLEIEMMVDLHDYSNRSVQAHINTCKSCGLALSEHQNLKERIQMFLSRIESPRNMQQQIFQFVARFQHELDYLRVGVAKELLCEDVEKVMEKLSDQQREVLRLRFGLDDGTTRTLEEVAEVFGTTRDEIRRIETKALHLLRNPNRSRRSRRYQAPDES